MSYLADFEKMRNEVLDFDIKIVDWDADFYNQYITKKYCSSCGAPVKNIKKCKYCGGGQ